MEEKESLWNPFSVNEIEISGEHPVKCLPKKPQELRTLQITPHTVVISYIL